MTWSYEPGTSTRDSLRSLIGDTDPDNVRFTDEELAAYLTLSADNVLLAAAAALDRLAVLAALKGKVMLPDLSVDGTAESKALSDVATRLRTLAASGEEDEGSQFMVAELVLNDASYRDRIAKQLLRGGV